MNIWTPHPVIPEPTREQIRSVAARMNISPDLAARHIWNKREEAIKLEKVNPLAAGYEPPIWKVCDALFGVPWIDQDWAERMRLHLTFKHPVKCILILGGQRGSKSEYSSKLVTKTMKSKDRARAWMLHTNRRMSVEYQQPLMWKYIPPELKVKKELRTNTAYIKYTVKNGFSDDRFILPNLSDCSFLAYEMDRTTVEGGNVDIINPDELVPSDWVETMMLRIAEKAGIMIITFTPVQGYNDTVKMFLDGAKTVKESTGFMLPKDGGEPDVARALGLSQEEVTRLTLHLDDSKKHQAASIWSRPEECGEWIEEQKPESSDWGTGTGRSQPAAPAGRQFEMVPRVMKPLDPEENLAVVYFHSSDNPYGNPLSVWRNIARKSTAFKKERFYGIATKMMAARFPRFSDKVHLVKASDIPKSGTNYHFVDPCSDRNWFQIWLRVTPTASYVYREWPGNYYIPGEGVPGPWALTDGKKPDGRMGPAQKSFGWGYAQYKKEIARVEGWQAYKDWLNQNPGEALKKSENDTIAEWDQNGPADELIYERYMDARFASVKSFDMGGMITLFEDIEEKVNLTFAHTSNEGEGRDSIDAGVAMINDALYFDDTKPIDFMNSPKLYICEDCINLIFALSTYTGADGQKGACKDPVDTLRFAYLKHCEYQQGWEQARRGGLVRNNSGSGCY